MSNCSFVPSTCLFSLYLCSVLAYSTESSLLPHFFFFCPLEPLNLKYAHSQLTETHFLLFHRTKFLLVQSSLQASEVARCIPTLAPSHLQHGFLRRTDLASSLYLGFDILSEYILSSV